MSRLSRPFRLTFALASLAILAAGVVVLRADGLFSPVGAPYAGACRILEMPGLVRDFTFDETRGLAYLSMRERGSARGSILLLDLNQTEPSPRAALRYDPAQFQPDALSLWQPGDRPARLFAVSGEAGVAPAIEIAEQSPDGAFVPLATVRDAAITHPVLLAAAAANRFYIAQHRPASGALAGRWQRLTRSGDDQILLYDGGAVSVVATDLARVTGMVMSPDGARLYVAEALARQLRVYRVEGRSLVLERRVPLALAPGRLQAGRDGRIWLVAYPRVGAYLATLEGDAPAIPAVVLRIDPRLPEAGATRVLSDDGSRLAAGVAIHWRQDLVLSAVRNSQVQLCPANP